MATFAQIVMAARQHAGMTAAEMDYSLCVDGGTAGGALWDATYMLANPGWAAPDWDTADEVALDRARQARAKAEALWEATRAEREAMIAAAKTKKYTGWSKESSGPIRYADA